MKSFMNNSFRLPREIVLYGQSLLIIEYFLPVRYLIDGLLRMPNVDSFFSKAEIFGRLETSFNNATKALESKNTDLANFILHKILRQVISLSNTTLLTPEEAVLFLRMIFTRIKSENLNFLPDLIEELKAAAKVTSRRASISPE